MYVCGTLQNIPTTGTCFKMHWPTARTTSRTRYTYWYSSTHVCLFVSPFCFIFSCQPYVHTVPRGVQTGTRMKKEANTQAHVRGCAPPPIYCTYIHIYILCVQQQCAFVGQPAKEGIGKRAVVDATCQPVLLYVLTGLPPWPRMKVFTMFDEPSAAFACALLFLFSAFDAAAAGGGAAGGVDCVCEASAGAAAVELRMGSGISLITFSMSSAYSPSSSVPSQRSVHAWLSTPNKLSVAAPSFVLVFNSWNCSVVNAPLCLSLPNSAFMPSKAAAHRESGVRAAETKSRSTSTDGWLFLWVQKA